MFMSRMIRRTATKSPFVLRPTKLSAPPVCRLLSSSSSSHNGKQEELIPGLSGASYNSLGGEPKPFAAPTAWQAEHNVDIAQATLNSTIFELTRNQTKTIEEVVPWFFTQMPASYFKQIPENLRLDHIKALAAVRDANMDMYLNLKSHTPDGRQIFTFIRPGTTPGTLLSMVEELPSFEDGLLLTRLHVFSSADNSLSLNMFIYGHSKPTPRPLKFEQAEILLKYAEKVQAGTVPEMEPNPLFERKSLEAFIARCSDNYLNIISKVPHRFLVQRLMYGKLIGSEGTEVQIEAATDHEDAGHYWVDVAVANSLPQVALKHACLLLFQHKFDVSRARLDVLSDDENGDVTMLRMLVKPLQEPTNGSFDVLAQEIKRSKWLDPITMDLAFERYPWLGVQRTEIVTALGSLLHPILAKENPLVYSKANILDMITKQRYIEHAAKVADLFLERFDPQNPLSNDGLASKRIEISEQIVNDVEDSIAKTLLLKMLDIVEHTLKTNIFMQNRYALSLRLDPSIMGKPTNDMPYGIFFVHGRRFNGFQVRFRDISRGGCRLVTPTNPEQYALESARQYDECYGLASAQQLKNKDIPEGGSKAVVLVDCSGLGQTSKNFCSRKSIKAFTDSILDLVVDTEETREKIVDFWGKKEVLYLGPDEQVIPEDIEWIIKQAARRGYETPAAFMSSKPKAGINHKTYAVTSTGVNVFLDVALQRVLNIDPRKNSFTVKITGGPDGDVAGNEIKILIREYGDNAKILGIADHSGCAEDPDGLDHEELLRLVIEAKCISHFDSAKLGPSGVLHTVDTEVGIKMRNSMHNRIVADAFVPCGGRPGTIDATNYKNFLKSDGTPTSSLIVEGANLFITPDAREKLFEEAGVVICKDSSANKCGVITSSYEICAAMLLDEDEFLENKDQIVNEVLNKLKELARLEAELLFREVDIYGQSLPMISQIVSNSINNVTDALADALNALSDDERSELLVLFRSHLPDTLATLSFDRVHERVPVQYVKNAIASSLASKVVYKEGTKFIDALPKKKLAEMALNYIRKEKEVATLMEALKGSNIGDEEKAKMMELLDAGGARTALSLRK